MAPKLCFCAKKWLAEQEHEENNTEIFLPNLFLNFWRFIFNLYVSCVCAAHIKRSLCVIFSKYCSARKKARFTGVMWGNCR